jgi:hypothetical protein
MEIIMSTDYATEKEIRYADLFDGRLEKYGIKESRETKGSSEFHYITDGTNSLSISADDDGMLGCISRHGGNNPHPILDAIAEVFDTAIFSEHQPQFWGCKTWEEWEEAYKEFCVSIKNNRRQRCKELYKYLNGEACDLQPGIEMSVAEIARELVHQFPELILPANRDRLLGIIYHRYEFPAFAWFGDFDW